MTDLQNNTIIQRARQNGDVSTSRLGATYIAALGFRKVVRVGDEYFVLSLNDAKIISGLGGEVIEID